MGRLILKYGNILDYLDGMDAIVNSANKYMICGSGVCGAIYKKANKDKLEKYCKNSFKETMKVNEIRITPGFDLGIDIIHIYCSKYYESENPIEDLKQSYINLFEVAKEKEYKNIISVSLGTGFHGYNHNEIAKDIVILIANLVKKVDINFVFILPSVEIIKLYKSNLSVKGRCYKFLLL